MNTEIKLLVSDEQVRELSMRRTECAWREHEGSFDEDHLAIQIEGGLLDLRETYEAELARLRELAIPPEHDPLMGDDKIAQYASQYVQPNAREVRRACEHVRDIYEPELQRLTEGWRKAFNTAFDWQEKSKAQEVELALLRELTQKLVDHIKNNRDAIEGNVADWVTEGQDEVLDKAKKDFSITPTTSP